MKSIVNVFLPLACLCLLASACKTDGFGANPYDPSTPVTVSEWPKVLSFSPEKDRREMLSRLKELISAPPRK